MSEQAPISEDRCWYCDQDGTDHKHGSGRSCCDCCSMHGSLAHKDEHAYKWVEDCLTAKNERIAALEAENRRLKAPVSDEVMEQMQEREYVHHALCSGSRRFPAGDPGHSCSCFSLHVPELDDSMRVKELRQQISDHRELLAQCVAQSDCEGHCTSTTCAFNKARSVLFPTAIEPEVSDG